MAQIGYFLLIVILLPVVYGTSEEMSRLYRDLMSGYNKILAPEYPPDNNAQVEFDLMIRRLIALEKQVLSLDVYLMMVWYDERLMWDPELYGDIEVIRIPSSQLWTPDILLEENAVTSGFDSPDINIVVTYDGRIFYSIPTQLHSFCATPVTAQNITCPLKFFSWSYDGAKLDLQLQDKTKSGAILYYGSRDFNQEWTIESAKAERNELSYACCPEKYIDITYKIKLNRST